MGVSEMRGWKIVPTFAALLLAAFTARPALADDNPSLSGWEFMVAPYVWLSEVHGHVGVRDRTADVDVSFSDIFDKLGNGDLFSASGHYEGRWNKKLITFLDVTGTWVKSDATGRRGGNAEVKSQLYFIETAIGYRVLDLDLGDNRHFGLEPIAGVRYTYNYNKVDGEIAPGDRIRGRTFDDHFDEDLIDPFIGGRITLDLLPDKLDWSFRGDGGGFGVGSDFAWQIVSVFLLRLPWEPWNTRLDAAAGYKLYDFHVTNGNKDLQLTFRGPIMGLGIHF